VSNVAQLCSWDERRNRACAGDWLAHARRYWIAAAIALAPPLVTPTIVFAQEAPGAPITTTGADTNASDASTYDRGHNTAVQDTPRPAYQALGIRAGGFMVYPKVAFTAVYDDNVFAVQNGAAGDFSFDIAPELDIQSNWSRNALAAYVRLDQDAYARLSSQNTTQYGAGLSGKLQFGIASNMAASLDYGHFTLPRSVSNNFGVSSSPLAYDYISFRDELTAQFNRVRLSLRFDDQDFQFHNGVTSGGAVVFVDNESHNDEIVTGRFEYALSPDAALDFEAQGNHRGYGPGSPAGPGTLTSSGYQLNAGANFDITHLLRGEFGIGYLGQTYVSSAFKQVQGLSGKVQLEWFPTRLTTVTVLARRDISPSQVTGSAGYVGSRVSAAVDHELLRNLILSGNLNFSYNKNIGIDRNDTLFGAGVSASWLITRHVGVRFAYAYEDQRTVGTAVGNSFTDNRGTVSLVLQL
jgi:hypothetical protein